MGGEAVGDVNNNKNVDITALVIMKDHNYAKKPRIEQSSSCHDVGVSEKGNSVETVHSKKTKSSGTLATEINESGEAFKSVESVHATEEYNSEETAPVEYGPNNQAVQGLSTPSQSSDADCSYAESSLTEDEDILRIGKTFSSFGEVQDFMQRYSRKMKVAFIRNSCNLKQVSFLKALILKKVMKR
jgi:hypothetical protein